MSTKVCNICLVEQSHENFHIDQQKPDGRRYQCKKCQKLSNQINVFQRIVRDSKSADKRYNRTSELDYIDEQRISDLLVMQENQCYYCEDHMVFGAGIDRSKDPNGLTLERVDNDLPHIIENCILACSSCNKIRGYRFSFNTMVRYAKAFKTNQKKYCSNCVNVLDIGRFGKSIRGRGGVYNYCKTCHNTRQRTARMLRIQLSELENGSV